MFGFFNKKEQYKLLKEKKEDIVYRMYKDKEPIEYIMETVNASKTEVLEMVRQKKKERRGE